MRIKLWGYAGNLQMKKVENSWLRPFEYQTCPALRSPLSLPCDRYSDPYCCYFLTGIKIPSVVTLLQEKLSCRYLVTRETELSSNGSRWLSSSKIRLSQTIFWKRQNGMLRHSLGGEVIFLSLQHFIASNLDLMPCLPSRQRREAIKSY